MAPLHSLISRFMRSLVMKFTLMTALLMVATATFLMVIENRNVRQENQAVLIERASMKAQILALNVSDDVIAEDRTRLQSRVSSLVERADVTEAFIADARRRTLVHSDPSMAIHAGLATDPLVVMALGSGETRSEIRGNSVHIAAPIYSAANRLVGVVYTQSSTDELHAAARAALQRHALIAAVALLIFLPIAGGLVFWALRPIARLTEAARTASSKSLDVRINVKTGDELEVLANAFNRMLSRIDSNLKRIHRLAYVDMVTELPNRERFRKEVERVARKAVEDETSGAVLFLDLDRFKRVNDSLGIGEGDRLLEMVARRLREAARGHDLARGSKGEPSMVARLGGDEFTVLVPCTETSADVARYAQQIISAIRRPFDVSGHQVFLGVSIGIAVFPQDGSEPESLLRHADLAMAHAKETGGNDAHFFEPCMNQTAFERLVLENELRDAVKQDQLVVYYQPKVRMSDGIIEGSEALVRWNHPTSGLLAPGHFIEAAEESGLIGEIGDWVMRNACSQAAEWASRGLSLPVAVNVSAMQFERSGFADTVMEILEQTGLPPELLEIELTESIAMRDPQRVIDQVQPLRDRGVKFAIDDFGTGHSSLSYLTRMPFDVFKIDQSFVRSMSQDPHSRAVVETILALAKALKLKTVAEGVETTEQLTALREEGATLAQGYLFSKPVPAVDFEAYARNSLADDVRAASA
ncbi:MAG: GGDEF domain-containing protein [Rhodobacterales bacterium CG15_BIG_FIL_POST_REV_8_21_14_020_59_13]|nr:MAG: GGDEF domain-containing protein [Rhodobacterales bacterium CG15_BIG_FIL_POST_REV_8_21_14_020_59_13]